MKRSFAAGGYAIGLNLLLVGVALGQPAPGHIYSPFNVASTQLPPGFNGHNVVSLYNALETKTPDKGRYETQAQYQARLKQLQAKPLFRNMQMWSPIAVTIPIDHSEYDTETGKLTAYINGRKPEDIYAGMLEEALESGNFSEDMKRNAQELRHKKSLNRSNELRFASNVFSDSGSYVARNGFGATVTVQQKELIVYGVHLTNALNFPFANTGEPCIFRAGTVLPVKPTAAERVEKNLRALLVGYLTTPYQATARNKKEAKFDDPEEITMTERYICARIKSIWFYDKQTGYVYAKISERPYTPPAPVTTPAATPPTSESTKKELPAETPKSIPPAPDEVP